jgi:hypothetical protein
VAVHRCDHQLRPLRPGFAGVEIQFPKGNSAVIKLDGAILDSGDWLDHYNAYWKDRHSTDLEWLNDHLLAVIEFKKNDKEIEKVFTSQVKPAMREREPADAYVLGVYHGADRLYLFQRRGGKYLRYEEGKNQKNDDSKVGDLSLHRPDPYGYLPDFDELQKRVNHAPIKGFIKRIHGLRDEAAGEYQKIFATNLIDWRDPNDVRAVVAIAQAFEDYSFVLSSKSDLYQLVFYNFANSFTDALDRSGSILPLGCIAVSSMWP